MNTLARLLQTSALLTLGACVRGDGAPTEGLVAYYPFDGDGQDESGRANHGYPNEVVPVEDRFGEPNRAFAFNGTTSFVRIEDSPSFILDQGLTFSAWVWSEPSEEIRGGYVLKKGQYLESGQFWAGLGTLQDIVFTGGVGACTSDWCDSAGADLALPAQAWFQFAGTCDDQTLTFYVNGQPCSSTASPGILKQTTTPLYLGCDFGSPGGYLLGRLDDVRVYNRALSAEEIAQLYQAEKVHPRLSITRTAHPDARPTIHLELLAELGVS